MKTMICFADHQSNSGSVIAPGQAYLHAEFSLYQIPKYFHFFFEGMGSTWLPLYPLEENIFVPVKVLISMKYISSPLMDPTGSPRD
jgi:hypothetical protein